MSFALVVFHKQCLIMSDKHKDGEYPPCAYLANGSLNKSFLLALGMLFFISCEILAVGPTLNILFLTLYNFSST